MKKTLDVLRALGPVLNALAALLRVLRELL